MPLSLINTAILSEIFVIVVNYLRKSFVVSKIFYIFATCSRWNRRPKIRKSRDINKRKIMSDSDEIKKWRTQSVKHKVAYVLMMDGVSFRYDEENGIQFSAPDFYVKDLIHRLVYAYGCSVKPIINEVK